VTRSASGGGTEPGHLHSEGRIHPMRRSIARALVATLAAGAAMTTLGLAAGGTTAAASAGASHRFFVPSGGPPVYNTPCSDATGFTSNAASLTFGQGGCAGYVGSGRDFRYAQATIRVPQTKSSPPPTRPHRRCMWG
jgi:hypothetical protein